MDPGPGVFDRDLDATPTRPIRPLNESITLYQRLIVNPCLAIVVIIFGAVLYVWANENHFEALTRVEAAFFVLSLLLLQYHCRDCGKTGSLIAYKSHLCPMVLTRWNERELPRFCGPSVPGQLGIWFILFAAAAILALVALAGA